MTAKDIFDKLSTDRRVQDIQLLRSAGGYAFLPEFEISSSDSPVHATCQGKSVLMFGSNDYLGLTRDRQVLKAAQNAVSHYGAATCGARLLNGTTALHNELERELALFLNKQDAVVFGTGFQTNIGTLAALAGPREVIIADELCHMSIVEGMRLSYARTLRFEHNNPESLSRALQNCSDKEGRIVVAEGVYSLGGETGALPELLEVSEAKGARFFLDDAHGLGVLGDRGAGTAEHFDVENRIDIIGGTFSKSLASSGGFIAADSEVINYIKHFSNAFIFSASPPPACIASALEALRIIQQKPQRRSHLLAMSELGRDLLRNSGFMVKNGATPIIIVQLSDDNEPRQASLQVGRFCKSLLEEGFYVHPLIGGQAVRFPILRINLTALHQPEHIKLLVEAMLHCADKCGVKLKKDVYC